MISSSRRLLSTSRCRGWALAGSKTFRRSQHSSWRTISMLPHASWSSSNEEDSSRSTYYCPQISVLPPTQASTTLAQRRFTSTTAKLDKSYREKMSDRASDYRRRAGEMRESSKREWNEFREHPGQSARKGAISFGTMIQKYGPVFVGTYMGVYFATLATLFAGVQSGILDPTVLFGWLGQDGAETKTTVDLVVDFMNNHSLTKPYAPYIEKNPAFANLAVAWIAVKFTEPVRFPVAVGLTPRIARYFGVGPKEAEPADTEHEDVEPPTDEDSSVFTKEEPKESSSSPKP